MVKAFKMQKNILTIKDPFDKDYLSVDLPKEI